MRPVLVLICRLTQKYFTFTVYGYMFHDHLGHIKLTAVSTECFVRFEHHIRDSGAEAWRMDHREGPTDFCYKYSEAL